MWQNIFIRAAAIAAILTGTLVPSFAEAALECEQPFVNQPPDHFITLCSEVIRSNPEAAWAYNSRGHAYRVKAEADKAIADYNEAIRLNPTYAAAYYNRGVAYIDKREYDTAITDFNEAIRLNPQYTQAYKNRGVA
jgi:tetratricopeptide (TPR) repeat protein